MRGSPKRFSLLRIQFESANQKKNFWPLPELQET